MNATDVAAIDEYPKRFVFSFGVILCVAAAAKLWSALGNARILGQLDPILGIQFRHLMLIVGLLEVSVGCACFLSRKMRLSTFFVAWLSTLFLGYRLGIWWLDWHSPCPCLGNLTDALHLSPEISNDLAKILLAYLLIGSYSLMVFWRCGDGKSS
jgi:hypothetical protein